LLHVAASLGKIQIIEWLLQYKDAAINMKDVESGYSALHRAIFHGQIQTLISLIKQGANLALLDSNGLTALDHALLDRPPHVTYSKHAPLEAYVWGTNSNYNLGTADNSTRNNPDLIEYFRKQNISVKKVALQKFHSCFLSSTGTVYTCGHGRGGRLGIGSETMLLSPKAIQIGPCMDVALGVDHSVFLSETGTVYTCGENIFHQLGHQPPPPRLLAPAPVGSRGGIKHPAATGVAAGRYHSVFWTCEAFYTWGLNAGQLGHIKGEKTIILPKVVTSFVSHEAKIEQVCVSDGATVVCTSKGDVVALYGYTTRKLGLRQHGIQQIQVVGGHLDPAVDPGGSAEIDFKLVAGGGTNLRVFILRAGKVLVWEEGGEKGFLACTLAVNRSPPVITQFAPFRAGLLLVSELGETWTANWPANHKPAPTNLNTKFQREASITVKCKRVPHVHRAVAAVSDPKGRNFCVLQVSPREALTEVPEVRPSKMVENLSQLLEEVSELDSVHDTVCVVGGQRFPAHSFMLASGSEVLSKELKFAETLNPTILEIQDIQPQIFTQILKYLYTKSCDLLKEGPCLVIVKEAENDNNANNNINKNLKNDILQFEGDPATISAFAVYEKNKKKKSSKKAEDNSNRKKTTTNPLLMFLEAGKLLGLYGLSKIVDCFRFSEGHIYRKSSPPRPRLEFSFKNLSELCDVTIETEEGDQLLAHKSLLVARSEYFMGMFSSGWVESSGDNVLKLQIKTTYVECILEYLYKDESRTINKSEDTEFISNTLVYADQLLIVRLKEICENQLSKLMTLKNVADMLAFAFIFQAQQLKNSCLQFVCINLSSLLENKGLENLDPEILTALDTFYRVANPRVNHRRLTPSSGYPSSDDIEAYHLENPLSLEELFVLEAGLAASTRQRPRRHSSGDKRRSPKPRLRTSESSGCSGSEDEDAAGVKLSQDMDKLSVLDFDIEEKEECESPDPADKSSPTSPPKVQERDTSFFSSLLGPSPTKQISSDETKSSPPKEVKTTTKKFPKLSQKERKRQSQGQEEFEPTSPNTSSPVKPWGGWNAASSPPAPSLSDIMQMEDKSGNTASRDRRVSETIERKLSESESKPEMFAVKKSSWKQMSWSAEAEPKTTTPTKQAAANPWNRVKTPEVEKPFSELLAAEANRSFTDIMAEDVQVERTLVKEQSKPLHLTQLEEKAMQELKQIYELQHPADRVSVQRVQRGNAAAPVWRKK